MERLFNKIKDQQEKQKEKLIDRFNTSPPKQQKELLTSVFKEIKKESNFLDPYLKDKDYSYQKRILNIGHAFMQEGNYFASFVCLDEAELQPEKEKTIPLNRAIVFIEGLRNKKLPKEKFYDGIKITITDDFYEKRAVMLLDQHNSIVSRFIKHLFFIERKKYKEAIEAYVDFNKYLKTNPKDNKKGFSFKTPLYHPYKKAVLYKQLAEHCSNEAEKMKRISTREAIANKIYSIYLYQKSLDNIDDFLSKYPFSPTGFKHRADILEKLGKHKEALACYKHMFDNKLT